MNIIEANNPTLAFNLFLARADKNDEIVTKRKRKGVKKDISAFTEEDEEEEEEEKGKFLRVTDLTTVRTSTYIDREEQINILMIYKVFYFLSTNKQTNYLFLFFRMKNIISATLRILTV